jgi:formate/nitrite transporter
MSTGLFGSDAYAPSEVAHRVQTVGVAKAQMALVPLAMLGILAGAFIGLGSMLFIIVKADPGLGFAASQIVGGLAFSLGLFLVVVAGAELFTGNNLLAMAWADGQISSYQVLRNWTVVCAANFAGAAGLALLVYLSGHTGMGSNAIGRAVVKIALAKQALPWQEAFFRGVLCNVLVCLAVWMAMAGRSVMDKAIAVAFPISAFVAGGFEHSIANMYLFPLAMLIQWGSGLAVAEIAVTMGGMLANLTAVIAGNLVGGSVLVGLTYHMIYRRDRRAPAGSPSGVDAATAAERPSADSAATGTAR